MVAQPRVTGKGEAYRATAERGISRRRQVGYYAGTMFLGELDRIELAQIEPMERLKSVLGAESGLSQCPNQGTAASTTPH